MKSLSLLLPLLFLVGCVTALPVSPEESCSMMNMKLDGVDYVQTHTSGYNHAGKPTGFNTSGTNLRCSVPKDPAESCEIEKRRIVAEPKQAFNDGLPGKKILTGTGYFFWILPGVAAKYYYDKQGDEALQKSHQLASEVANRCNTTENRSSASTP